jgi:prepilin-type N-terminal cleavage/methylation domain-containing protein
MRISSLARRGFSLIELLCVILLISVIGGLLTLILKETLEVERVQAAGFQQLLLSNALADQFRADVAQAESAPPRWGKYKSDEQTLILQMKKEHVVYLWEDDKLQRFAIDDQQTLERTLPVSGNRVEVKFVHDAANAKLIRLQIRVVREGNAVPAQTLDIAAALGGDWR